MFFLFWFKSPIYMMLSLWAKAKTSTIYNFTIAIYLKHSVCSKHFISNYYPLYPLPYLAISIPQDLFHHVANTGHTAVSSSNCSLHTIHNFWRVYQHFRTFWNRRDYVSKPYLPFVQASHSADDSSRPNGPSLSLISWPINQNCNPLLYWSL